MLIELLVNGTSAMFRNRIRKYARIMEQREAQSRQAIPDGFVLVPIAHLPALAQQAMLAQQQVYQMAFEQAQASVAAAREFFGD